MRGLKHYNAIEKIFAFVASFTDAWIETSNLVGAVMLYDVASFTDAWIETSNLVGAVKLYNVASFTDAWIETRQSS